MTGRATLLWMIPLNLLLIVWIWIGRIVFGVGGWMLAIFLFSVVPLMLLLLLVTTVLAYTQPGRPRHLTRSQRLWQWVVWAGMFGFGLVAVDFGDTKRSEMSALTQVFGWSEDLLGLSWLLELAFAAVVLVAWAVLLGTLTLGRRRVAAD